MLSTKTLKVFFLITTLAFGCLLLMVGYGRLAWAHGGGAAPDYPYPPDVVRVERIQYGDPNASDYTTDHVESEYLVGVLIGELRNHFMPWHLEAARAQAVAARTYATYHCRKNHLKDGTWGLYDWPSDQVYWPEYDPGSWLEPVNQSNIAVFRQAVSDTVGLYIVYRGSLDALDPPHDFTHIGLPIEALFGADNGITTTSAYDEPGSEYEYARSVHDPVSEGCLGHCWGFSQRGAHRWASQHGWNWQQILYHYYTNIEFQQKHAFTASYYNDGDTNPDNDFMPSKLVSSQADVSIDYNWSGAPEDHNGNPIPGMPADHFSIRWTGQISVTNDSWYTFYLTSDDGARLYVDGKLIIDDWAPAHLQRTRSGAIRLAPGNHSVQLDYYEATDAAIARLSWLPGQGLVGEYYNAYQPGVGGVGGGIAARW